MQGWLATLCISFIIIIIVSSSSSSSTRKVVWIRRLRCHKSVTACRRNDWTYIKQCKNPHKLAKHCWRGECWSWRLDPTTSIPNTRFQKRNIFEISETWKEPMVFSIFQKVFRKPKTLRENRKHKRTPKKTNNIFLENRKNKVSKGFRPTLGYGFGLLFPRRFYKTKQSLEKP